MGRIVVGVDGSGGGADALRWAAREGTVRDWSVTALLAWGLLDQHRLTPGEAYDPHYDEAQAAAALDRYVEVALGSTIAAQIEDRTVVCDLAPAALLDASASADLLVVGARGLGGFRGLLVGSVSEKCLHHTRCPIVVVRGVAHEADRIGRVVVGIDGSGTATRALHWAMDEARAHQASVEVVYSSPLPYVAGGAVVVPNFDMAAIEVEAHRMVDEIVDAVNPSGLPSPVTRTVTTGGPAASILQAAESADLVVVGSRGRGGLKGLLLGSVSRQVVHHSPCPVLVVPPTAADAGRGT